MNDEQRYEVKKKVNYAWKYVWMYENLFFLCTVRNVSKSFDRGAIWLSVDSDSHYDYHV